MDLESAPDYPASVEATEESYVGAIQSLGKHFLKALDNWSDFDKERNWTESELGDELYIRCKDQIPEQLRQELTGNQVGMAAHLAYQAFIQN